MTAPPHKTLLSISCPNLFVPMGKSQLGGALSGLSITGGAAVGSLGATQGLINVIMTIEETITDPMSVIQPAEPLFLSEAKFRRKFAKTPRTRLVNEVKPDRKLVRKVRLVSNLRNLISPTIVSSGRGMRRKCLRRGLPEQL